MITAPECSMHEVRMLLQALPSGLRLDALLVPFRQPGQPGMGYDTRALYAAQERAGRLLVAVRPRCLRSLEEVLRMTMGAWNVSVEQFPHYLSAVFGREVVVETARRLAGTYPEGSREARALGTVRFWLTGRAESVS